MTKEQGELIDNIIELHRQNSGVFHWNAHIVKYGLSNSHDYRTLIFALDYLKKEEVINEYSSNNLVTKLTEKGQNWTSYENCLDEIHNKEKALGAEAFQKRNWLWIAVFAYIAGLFSDPFKKIIMDKFFLKNSPMEMKKDSNYNKNRSQNFNSSSGKIYKLISIS